MQEKAIVIGGSIAGLLAARVLSDYFKEVILIEKDNCIDNGKVRIGTPQANHIHILLVKGREILQDFFPELEGDLLKKGANKIDFLNNSRYHLPSGWAPKFNSGIITFACTRTLLENTIRHQIKKISKIKIEQGKQIISFVLEKSRILYSLLYLLPGYIPKFILPGPGVIPCKDANPMPIPVTKTPRYCVLCTIKYNDKSSVYFEI